jgi:adenosylhomocysteine nucleosidase
MAADSIIGIIMATRLEAEPFITSLVPAEAPGRHPVPVYAGGRTVLAVSGIGKTNAAIATAYCCAVFHPRVILNLGAAGATGTAFAQGDIRHITSVVEYDRPHLRTTTPHIHVPSILPGFPTASLSTQDRAVIDKNIREEIARAADLVDMEGASVVQTAHTFGIPCYLFKFVSDTPDHTGPSDIIDYISAYRSSFFEFIVKTVIPVLTERHQE